MEARFSPLSLEPGWAGAWQIDGTPATPLDGNVQGARERFRRRDAAFYAHVGIIGRDGVGAGWVVRAVG